MQENILDRAIAFVSPKWGASRARSRVAYESVRAYDGASRGRRTEDWGATSASASTEAKGKLEILRNRTRDLDRNNPYIHKAINVIRNNTVGIGIRLSIKDTVPGREILLKAWHDWANSRRACDFDEHSNLYGLQSLMMRTMITSGEVLIVRRRMKFKKGIVPLQIQILEPDYLDERKDTQGTSMTKDGGKIMQGIEYLPNGKRKGYWLYDHHPGDYLSTDLTSNFIAEKDVIHLYDKERPGQERGVPFGTSSMNMLRDLKEYQDFELLKQKLASCFGAFVQKDNPNQDDFESSEGETTEKLEPGIIQYLSPGEQVTFASPPNTTGYGEHTKRLQQASAAGLGVTYESMTGDLSQVNYSSFRGGWLEFQRLVLHLQYNVMIPIAMDGIFEWWCEAAKMAGINTDNVAPQWTAPKREMIDPTKETEAMKEAIKGGITTLSEVARENGWDPDELLAELKADMSKIDKLGLVLDTDVRNELSPTPAAPTEGGKPAPKAAAKKAVKK
jgi:lambda family phage portal protein